MLFFHPGFGYLLLYLGRCAVATVAVCGFGSWSSVFHCGMVRQISPLPPCASTPSQTAVCSTMGESIRPPSFHNPTLSANKHVVPNLPLLAIGCRVDCSGEGRTSPFNGIERSLSRAVVIKSKSLPISAVTFATALSLYDAHDGRKHKHNPTFSAKKHVVQICRSSLSAAADGRADGSGERRTSPVNGIERLLNRGIVPKSKRLPVSDRYHVSYSVVFLHRAGTLAKGCPLSKLFSKAEPLPFEKELNINLVYSSCLKHANKMLLGGPRQVDQRTQSFPFPIVIHQSLDPSARALKRQAPCLYMQSRTRKAQNASTRRVDAAVEVIICA